MRISTLASKTGLPIGTIRYYERMGLISSPPRTKGNYRDFQADTIVALEIIKLAKKLGCSLKETHYLLKTNNKHDLLSYFRSYLQKIEELNQFKAHLLRPLRNRQVSQLS